jgi:ribonuclease HI
MELLAVIVALESLKFENSIVDIYTDSRYVVDAVEKKWLDSWVKIGFKKKKNEDLWMRFLEVYKKHHVKLHWIKGHNNHPENERCDRLAVEAGRRSKLIEDKGYLNVN